MKWNSKLYKRSTVYLNSALVGLTACLTKNEYTEMIHVAPYLHYNKDNTLHANLI